LMDESCDMGQEWLPEGVVNRSDWAGALYLQQPACYCGEHQAALSHPKKSLVSGCPRKLSKQLTPCWDLGQRRGR